MSRFAIADIHGCSKTFKKLLKIISFSKEDELYLLGDYVNKGPDSKGVLDQILEFKRYKFNIHCVRGNHDQMLLDASSCTRNDDWMINTEKTLTLKSFNIESPEKINPVYIEFLTELPYYIETEDYLMVHAGFNFKEDNIFSDTQAMMNIKEFTIDLSKTNGRKVLHGHFPHKLDSITSFIESDSSVLKLDGGCVYYKNEGMGNLIAFDLDTWEIVVQRNIDQPYDVRIR